MRAQNTSGGNPMTWEIMGANVRPRQMHLLVSSMSARGRAIEVGPKVVQILRNGGWDVTVSVTTAEDTPRKVALASDAPYVAALGGDGYLSQVAQGVHGTESVFVPFPGGRGNDLCRALGIGADPFERARAVARLGLQTGDDAADIERHIRDVDAVWIEQKDKKPMIVMGVLSLGYEAHVNQIANDSWFRSGPVAYGYGALAGFTTYKESTIRARVDGVERDLSGWVASVSNSGMFGGGIHFVPSSDLNDGQMELVHVGPLSRREVLAALTQILRTRNAEHPLVKVSKAQEIEFTAPAGLQAWADGDPVATVPFTVRTEKGAVRMLA